ncbi:MAG: hypothetical protein J0L77_08320 [Alphaproteobacteria bacterium]|nr:hypothetical protein [Alphaproteobacteria bacterium]
MRFIPVLFSLAFTSSAHAQGLTPPPLQPSEKNIAEHCVDAWNSPRCHQTLIEENRKFVLHYADILSEADHHLPAERVRNFCEPAIALTKNQSGSGSVKLGESFKICLKAIGQEAKETSLTPNPLHLEIMIYPGACLSGDADMCQKLSEGLRRRHFGISI